MPKYKSVTGQLVSVPKELDRFIKTLTAAAPGQGQPPARVVSLAQEIFKTLSSLEFDYATKNLASIAGYRVPSGQPDVEPGFALKIFADNSSFTSQHKQFSPLTYVGRLPLKEADTVAGIFNRAVTLVNKARLPIEPGQVQETVIDVAAEPDRAAAGSATERQPLLMSDAMAQRVEQTCIQWLREQAHLAQTGLQRKRSMSTYWYLIILLFIIGLIVLFILVSAGVLDFGGGSRTGSGGYCPTGQNYTAPTEIVSQLIANVSTSCEDVHTKPNLQGIVDGYHSRFPNMSLRDLIGIFFEQGSQALSVLRECSTPWAELLRSPFLGQIKVQDVIDKM